MKWIKPSKIEGKISAPPSKSIMLRATAAASLAAGESRIINPSFCDDALAGLYISAALGAQCQKEDDELKIRGGRSPVENVLNCRESGLCLRMFAPIAALFDTPVKLTGYGSLMSRPVGMMEMPFKRLGALFSSTMGFPPLMVKGPLHGGTIRMDGSLSSQFLTGLLLALPLCPEDSEILVDNLSSKPYVALTLSLLNLFGISVSCENHFQRFFIRGNQCYQNTTCSVEGDWSGASFLLVAGAISGSVSVANLHCDSFQADREILKVLRAAGAGITVTPDTVTVQSSDLRAFEFDATECPDLFPPLVALACFCRGRSRITGVNRLQHKESNRTSTLLTEFSRIGAKIRIKRNQMEIEGARLTGGMINSHNDHRIAMAGAVAGLKAVEGVHIHGWKSISKSYPGFFKDLQSIGG